MNLPSYFVMGNILWFFTITMQLFVQWSHGCNKWEMVASTIAFSISYVQVGGMLGRQKVDDEVKELEDCFQQTKKFNAMVEKELAEIQLFKLQLEKEKVKNGLLHSGADVRESKVHN